MVSIILAVGAGFFLLTALTQAFTSFLDRKDKTKKHGKLYASLALFVILAGCFAWATFVSSSSQSTSVQISATTSKNANPTASSIGNTSFTSSPSDTPTPSPTPQPPPPKPGDLLYQWTPDKEVIGSSDWSKVGNMIVNNGQGGNSGDGPTLVLFDAGKANILNYKIVVHLQVVGIVGAGGFTFPRFWICARAGDNGGYEAGLDFLATSKASIVSYDSFMHALKSISFDPTSKWYTYTMTVNMNRITLQIDNSTPLDVTDNSFTSSGGLIGLRSNEIQVSINSFKVYAV